jgi:hypothetical protein
MSNEELSYLFNKYLNRNFTNYELIVHGNKTVEHLENEILNCSEYLNLNQKNTNINSLKIAILLSGHIRKNSILKGFSQFCNNENYHVFIHTWDNIGIKGNETLLDDLSDPTSVISEINKFTNVKKYEIENNKSWIESQEIKDNYFNYSSPEIFIKSQLYSINKSYKLMEQYSTENNIEYDMVLKIRFDCDMTDFNLTNKTISDIKTHDIIFTPNHDNQHTHMDYGTSCWACDSLYYKHNRKIVHIFQHTNIICDLFAYGSKSSMKQYCDLYNNYDKLNDSFFNENLKQFKKVPKNIIHEKGNYNLKGYDGHVDSLYYYYCSYPERLLQFQLKDYMLVQSRDIKLNLVR